MIIKASILRPGLLVSLKSTMRGGVHYTRTDLEADHTTEDGAQRARWETSREIPDPDEFNRATAARGKARSMVAAVCCPSSFGLLCPESAEADLGAAVEEARKVADEHNATASLTRVDVFVLVGRIAQNDAEAARAITDEVRGLLEQMRAGIKDANPEAIREAANKARALGAMLTEGVADKVSAAIAEARRAAREIVKRVEKDGQTAALVVAACSVQAIESARFAFLDLEAEEATSEAPGARAIDMEPEAPAPALRAAAAPAALALEF